MGGGKVPGAGGIQPLSGWLELASAIEQAPDSRPRRCRPDPFDPNLQDQGRVDGLIDANSPDLTKRLPPTADRRANRKLRCGAAGNER